MSVLWHCAGCRTSGELYRRAVTYGEVLWLHAVASPRCRATSRIRIRGGLELDEERRRDRCRACGHEAAEHGSGTGKPCWHGARQPQPIDAPFRVNRVPVCACPGYRGPRKHDWHFVRRRGAWWKGGYGG